jgi:hypothetical protein
MTQEEAGVCIGVSRGTVQRLLASARCKVARALVGHKALAVSGAISVEKVIIGSVIKVDPWSSRSPPVELNISQL